jgi:beta-glucanase (GH16 family)
MNKITLTSLICALLTLQACEPEVETQSLQTSPLISDSETSSQSAMETSAKIDSNVVWAVNIGGAAYQGDDGIEYLADQFEPTSSEAQIESIKGSQDMTVYQTYREGEMSLQQNFENGIYDLTFRFAEPKDIAVGARVFDVLAEGQVVIPGLDVKLARDGNSKSSVDRTVLNVEINDGVLNIQFNAIAGEPLLNAMVVRAKHVSDLSEWTMVWQDEFNYHGPPDSGKWNFDIWPAGKVNDEQQQYSDSPDNVRVENGVLVIEAHVDEGQITSARIHSAGKGDLHYGRVEVRAKLAEGQGTWPAIWMLPSDPFKYASNCGEDADWQGSEECDAWPNSGEIDIMEHVGYDQNRVHGTVHTKAYYWVNGEQRKASVEAKDVAQEFHVYAMNWGPERIDMFLDGVLYFTYLKDSDDWQAWPFDHPFHLILNLAVGGGWGGAGGPTDMTVFPTRMEIDYARMYKRQSALSVDN